MSVLNVSACPICHANDSLSRETIERAEQSFVWNECSECGSVLMWMGDDQWAYQRVGQEDKAYILKQPMTLGEIERLLPPVEEVAARPSATEELSDTERDVPSKTQVPQERKRANPSRLLFVGLAVTLLGFIGAVIFLLFVLPLSDSATPQQASVPEGTPTPAFAEGDEVRLVPGSGGYVALRGMESGCQLLDVLDRVALGTEATVGSGLCYDTGRQAWYHHIIASDGSHQGWVQAGEMVRPNVRRPMKSSTSSGHAVHLSERSDASEIIIPSSGRHGQGRIDFASGVSL
jgi:hypothetical protein